MSSGDSGLPGQASGGSVVRGMVSLALGVLLIAGIGIAVEHVFFPGNEPRTAASIPDIKPDDAPIKTMPTNPGGLQVPNQNQIVYQSIGQGAAKNQPPPQLAPPPEQPQAPPIPAPPIQAATADMTPPPPSPLALVPAGNNAAPNGGSAPPASPIAPASANAPPPPAVVPAPAQVATAALPPKPASFTPPAQSTGPVLSTTPMAGPAGSPAPAPASVAGHPLSLLPDSPTTIIAATDNPPAPPAAGKPVSLTPTPAPAPVAVASAAPSPAAFHAGDSKANDTTSGAGGDYLIQLAAVGSEDQARATWQHVQTADHDLVGSLTPDIARADLGSRGVFWRVRAGPLSQDSARQLCEALSKRGQGCLIAHR